MAASVPPPPNSNLENTLAPSVSDNSRMEGEEKKVRIWERPWSIEEMRQGARDWSLAGDAGMLQFLQTFSEQMISKTHSVQEQVNSLLHEAKLTDVRAHNTFNDFIMLANTQFVENRVYDEDVSQATQDEGKKEDQEKTREQREAELIPRVTEAIHLGLNVLDTAFEKLDIKEAVSDSDEDDDSPYRPEAPLEAKDPYLNRPLPYLIGSTAFKEDDDVGLVDVSSDVEDDEGSISETESEEESDEESSEEESSSEEEVKKVRRPTKDQFDSESESEGSDLFGNSASEKEDDFGGSESEEDEETETKTPAAPNFADELAAKLGGAPPPQESPPRKQKHGKKSKEEKKKSMKVPEKPEEDDLFGQPSPEEDGLFSPGGGLFSTGGKLFDDDDAEDGGLFDDVDTKRKTKPKEEPEELEEEPAPEPVQPKTKSGKKMPAGAVSIFAGGDDDLFGSSTKEDEEVKPSPVATRKSPPKKSGGGGLFDDDEEEEDLFGSVTSSKPSAPVQKPAAKPVALFADEDEEEGDDLFGEQPVTKVSKPPTKPEAKETPPSGKKLPPGAVSMFAGGVNPLVAALKAKQKADSDQESQGSGWSDEEEDKKSTVESVRSSAASQSGVKKSGGSSSQSSGSLFAEEPDDSLFTPSAKTAPAKQGKPKVSLFDDEDSDEDFFTATSKPAKSATSEVTKPRGGSLFLENDDGGELFPSSPKTKPVPAAAKPKSGDPLFGEDLFGSSPRKEEPPSKKTVSLFEDDDEEDSGIPTKPAPSKPPKTLIPPQKEGGKPRTKSNRSLFEDDDVLFGTPEDNPTVDLFGAGSPLTPTKENKFPPSSSESASSPTKVKVAGVTTTSSSDAFGDEEDDDDLFAAKPAANKSAPAAKGSSVTIKGATTTQSSTDLFGDEDDDEQDGFFKKKPAPPVTKPKKPAGAVSMFGGMDPSALLKNKKPAATPPAQTEEVPKKAEKPKVEENHMVNDVEHEETEDIKPAAKPPPKRSNAIGKLQANLSLNPSALLPGAAPPIQQLTPPEIDFDKPVQSDTLQSLQKDRAKIQTKRRPPSRRGRQVAAPSSASDTTTTTAPMTAAMPTPSRPSNDIPRVPPLSQDLPPSDDQPDALLDDEPDTSHKTLNNNIPKKTPDLFSREPPDDDLFDRVPPPDDYSNDDFMSNDDIFSPSSQRSNLTSRAVVDIDDEDDDDDLFGSIPPKPVKSDTKKNVNDSDIFGDSPTMKPASKPASKPQDFSDKNSVPSADTDIFSSKPSQLSKPSPDSDDDIFTTASSKPKKPSPLADDEDIFATTPSLSSKKATTSDDIFASGSSKTSAGVDSDIFSTPSTRTKVASPVDDDIFASPSANKTLPSDDDDIFATTKPTKASAKVIPDDDDIFATRTSAVTKPSVEEQDDRFAATASKVTEEEDDIFAEAAKEKSKPSKPAAQVEDEEDIFAAAKPTKSKRPKKAKTKDEDLFNDDTDIFADIPAAKPKEKKKKAKAVSSAKPLFKDDIDDIFATSSSSKSKTKKATTKKAPSKKDNFDAEPADIFDDPLNALGS